MQTTNASANKVGKSVNNNAAVSSKSATAAVKTQRVLETRDMWSVIFNHTAALVAKSAKGFALSYEFDRKGFAFGTTKECPHCRAYAKALLVGFVSRKANKVLGETDGLSTIEERTKIAIAILTATKLETTPEKAKSFLAKTELAKQAKTFSEAVLNEVQKLEQEFLHVPTTLECEDEDPEGLFAPTEQAEAEATAPTEQAAESKTPSPKGKKAADGSKPKRGGKRGSTQQAANQ